MTDGQLDSSTVPDQDVFVAEFRRWRDVRGSLDRRLPG
jgi:hypothetical protein